MPPLGTFTNQVNIVDALISWTNKFESATPSHTINNIPLLDATLMCKKSLWSSLSVVHIKGCDRIYSTFKSAILPVPTEMYRIQLNEFIVLYSPLESEALKM
jgi:hypothetical protein